MEFKVWLEQEINKLKAINAALEREFGSVSRDYQQWLFEDAREPWGFVKNRRQDNGAGNSAASSNTNAGSDEGSASRAGDTGAPKGHDDSGKGVQGSQKGPHPISPKQLALIQRHMQGKLGPEIARMIKTTGKPLDQLTSSEASGVIDFILGGGR